MQKRTQPKFEAGQQITLIGRPTRNAKIERVIGRYSRQWQYQVSYQIFDQITPEGSKRYSQPFPENDIEGGAQ